MKATKSAENYRLCSFFVVKISRPLLLSWYIHNIIDHTGYGGYN